MPTISLVTAVVAGLDEHLPDTYASLVSQEMPEGWDWQWVVQEDGVTGEPEHHLPSDDPRVSYAIGFRGRAATARTLALARVRGKYVRGLDADDVLTAGALFRDIEVLETQDVAWVVSAALDLHPDGSLAPGPCDPPPGRLPSRLLFEEQKSGTGVPVVCLTVTAHTALVRLLGGWQALPLGEDTSLLLALEAVSSGWMLAEPSMLYRRWPKQSTAPMHEYPPCARAAGLDVMLDRAEALRAAGWTWQRP